MLKGRNIYSFALPFLVVLFAISAFVENLVDFRNFNPSKQPVFVERGLELQNAGLVNILSENDLTPGVLDTVFTDMESWLELRIDRQTLYQHWRDGRIDVYPISSGNPYGGPTSLESRPGLFAIFMKVEHHKSSQFNSANMYHFMPFNQGIGFHSIDGNAYYAHLGVRPSSHGCIRMKHAHAKKIFEECPIGTLVLVSKGKSARTVSFVNGGFVNEQEYSKDYYKWHLARNLRNLLTGKYFVEKRERFVLDPKAIPVSGIYNGYDAKLPESQYVPRSFASFSEPSDKTSMHGEKPSGSGLPAADAYNAPPEMLSEDFNENVEIYDPEVVKKYFSNPIGVLPYFGPKK